MSGSILGTQLTRTWVDETWSLVLRWALGSPWPRVLILQVPSPPRPPTWLCDIVDQCHPHTSQHWGSWSLGYFSFLLVWWSKIMCSSLLKNLGQAHTPHSPYLLKAPINCSRGWETFCKGPDYFRLCGPRGPYYSCSPLPRSLKEALDNVTKCGCVPVRHLQK